MLEGTDDEGLQGFVNVFDVIGAIGGGNAPGSMYPRGEDRKLIYERADIPAGICGLARTLAAQPLEEAINNNFDQDVGLSRHFGRPYANFQTFQVYGEMGFLAYQIAKDIFARMKTVGRASVLLWRTDCPFASTDAQCTRKFPFDDADGNGSAIAAYFDALYDAPTDIVYLPT